MTQRINTHLAPVTIDYDRDVLPLTPSGNATERHMLVAYTRAVEERIPRPVEFWADKLNLPPDQVAQVIGDVPKFQNMIRLKLMKRGGVGYVQPSPESFPTLEAVNQFVAKCGALPCATWLDGTSVGEQAIEELLELVISKGVVALNIIPDRNWNIPDPETRHLKAQKLYEIVHLAEQLALPLNIGTEMSAFGQKPVDDFDAPELAPVRQAFLEGARFVHGHTVLHRALGLGYQSEWARTHLPSRRARNKFYTKVGYLIRPGHVGLERIRRLGSTVTPSDILAECPD
ncbi:MAG: hypothetical protein AB1817_03680 [Chloroflexota bacterium]